MKKTVKIFLDIITPSLLGIVSYIIVFIIVMAGYQWNTYGSNISNVQTSDLKGTIFYSPTVHFIHFIKLSSVNNIMFYVFWIIAATIIYFIASRIISNASEAAEGLLERHYIWPKGADKNRPLKVFFEKLLFHLSMLIILIIYLIKIPPILNNWLKSHYFHFALTTQSIKEILLLFLFLTLFLHGIVILFRLLFTRRRLVN